MRIAVDLDSTINTLYIDWLNWYNKEYGTNVIPEDIISWDTHKHVPHGEAIYDFFDIPNALYDVGVEPYAVEVMERLCSNHDVYIVTSVVRISHYGEKRDWVETHLPFFNLRNFIACSSKGIILTDVMLDDGLHNLDNFEGVHAVVYDQPWNRSDNHYKRVQSWPEFLQYIERLAPRV